MPGGFPRGRRPLTRADLPEQFTPETVRRLDMFTARRLSQPDNGILSADEQRSFDLALRSVMQDTADRLERAAGVLDERGARRRSLDRRARVRDRADVGHAGDPRTDRLDPAPTARTPTHSGVARRAGRVLRPARVGGRHRRRSHPTRPGVAPRATPDPGVDPRHLRHGRRRVRDRACQGVQTQSRRRLTASTIDAQPAADWARSTGDRAGGTAGETCEGCYFSWRVR
jgi:hypothetical protein